MNEWIKYYFLWHPHPDTTKNTTIDYECDITPRTHRKRTLTHYWYSHIHANNSILTDKIPVKQKWLWSDLFLANAIFFSHFDILLLTSIDYKSVYGIRMPQFSLIVWIECGQTHNFSNYSAFWERRAKKKKK